MSTTPTNRPSEQFSSPVGLILAALGMAIGTGNIWRFPRVLAANEGGTFLIPWAIFLFTWSIPLLMVEFGLGRRSRRGPIGAFATVFGARTAFMGLFVALCTCLIMFYYSVVTGWCLRYLGHALFRGFEGVTAQGSEALFDEVASGGWAVAWHGVALGLACGVVALGVTRGIERASRIMIPVLAVIVLIAAVRALLLEGAGRGVAFMFDVNWAALGSHEVWLQGLSQSAWSTGAGWGLLLCYAIYAPSRQRPGITCVATGVGNNLASLLAALAIVPAVFALMPLIVAGQVDDPDAFVRGELADSGPALTGVTFVWMPVLLERLSFFGMGMGRFASVGFFMTLTFAAMSSLIAMVELGVRVLLDFGLTRRRAVAAVAVIAFLGGAPSAMSQEVFGNQDWVWGLGLILSGGLLTIGVIRYGVGRFRREFLSVDGRGVGAWFNVVLGVALPLQFACLMGWWCIEAYGWTAGSPEQQLTVGQRLAAWLDPRGAYSIGTCLVQWAVVLAVGLVLNRWLARRTASGSVAVEG